MHGHAHSAPPDPDRGGDASTRAHDDAVARRVAERRRVAHPIVGRGGSLVGLGILAALLAFALSQGVIYGSQRALLATIGEARQGFAGMGANQVRTAVGSAAAGVRAVAAQPTVAAALVGRDPAAVATIAAMFREVRQHALFIDALVLVDAAGDPVVTDSGGPLGGLAIAGLRQVPGSFRVWYLEGRPTLVVREPVGSTGASMVGALSLSRIVAQVGQSRFGDTGAVTVATSRGEVLGSSEPRRRDRDFGAPEIMHLIDARQHGVVVYASTVMGRRELAAVAPVSGLPLSFVVSQAESEALAALRGLRWMLGWTAWLLLVTALGVGWLGLRARRRGLEALAASELRFRGLIEMSRGFICEHDLDGRLVMVSPAAAASLGYRRDEMEGRRLHEFVPEALRAELDVYLRRIARRGEDDGVLAMIAKDGQVQLWDYHNRLLAVPGGVPHVIGHAQDTTERRAREAALRETGLRDPLTGVHNRRRLAEFERNAPGDAAWGCVAVDLDHFKEINDTFGHQRGDEVLIEMARLLERHARPGDLIVRMGGDEFLILVADGTASAEAIAARLRDAGPREAPCGFSIGTAIRERGELLQETIERADRRLYSVRTAVRSGERRQPP